MDLNCEHTVIDTDVLESNCPGGVYTIDIADASGTIPSSPIIDVNYVGQQLSYLITETNSGSSCFGNIIAYDSGTPILSCQPNVSINLSAAGDVILQASSVVANVWDNCDPSPALSVAPNFFTCNEASVPITVYLTATDASGGTSSCSSVVTASDVDPPILSCLGSVTLNLDASGTVTLNPQDALNFASDNCPFSLSASQTIFDCSNLGSNPLSITASDSSNNVTSCFTNIDIVDPANACVPQSLFLTGTITTSQTFRAIDFIQFDATIPPGVSIILQAPNVFTVDGCDVQLGAELDIQP